MMRRRNCRIFYMSFITMSLVLVAACAPPTDNDLPWFAYEASGRVLVDIEAGTEGRGNWNPSDPYALDYTYAECQIRFDIQVVGHQSAAPPQAMVHEPLVGFSNELHPEDGIAQFAFVPVVNETAGALDTHLFFDTDWGESVGSDVRLFVPPPFEEREPGSETDYTRLLIPAGKHVHHTTSFESHESLERCLVDFSMLLTNIEGRYEEVLQRVQRLDVAQGDIAILVTVTGR